MITAKVAVTCGKTSEPVPAHGGISVPVLGGLGPVRPRTMLGLRPLWISATALTPRLLLLSTQIQGGIFMRQTLV